MKRRIRTTPEQRKALEILKESLAENGYFIFPVARKLQKHGLDLVMVPKYHPQQFVVAHAMRDKSVTVRPYAFPPLYSEFRRKLANVKAPCRVRWNRKQLAAERAHPQWHHGYLSPVSEKEYYRLIGVRREDQAA